ncbi:RHS repeat protein [Draconibacterium sediminis]|uniref:YD repeat-containing protein n=1 Tax=Draconibacterium sediminis TaxID=1544798 RepID=A0A0D8JE82_9BACT|nr:RHS repeat protein [Draconibacterium sediminis]KJF44163.1 hypothetical protein LH29_01145 [Draconibacterium sediminis]
MKLKIKLLFNVLVFFVVQSYAQQDSPQTKTMEVEVDSILETASFGIQALTAETGLSSDIIPPSPEIEMINKFTDYPVNTQTGLPEVNVPLYEVVCGDLKLPISISYHASGRKTYDRNGPIGLHWVLNTGGLVSRTVYGIRDDDVWKFPSPFPIVETLTVQDDFDFLAGVNQSLGVVTKYDTEYDIFSYSYNGGSGNFILKDINNNKVPEVIPNKKIQINVHQATPPASTSYYFDYIEMLDEFGVYYRFGKSIISGESNRETSGNATTAWFISEIISANKQDTIHFKYTTTGKVRRTYPQQIKLRDDHRYVNSHKSETFADKSDTEVTFSTSYGSARISEIIFNNGRVHFTLNGSTDIIDKMGVYHENELIRTIEFPKTLLDAPVGLSTFDASQALIYKLDNVLFKDKSGTTVKQYEFDYYPSTKFNVRQSDWWGYYNRASSTSYRIPVFDNIPWVGTNGLPSTISIGNSAADRIPDLTGMQSGMLKSVTYPTGGQTEFIYEHNYYKTALSQEVKKCGGLRIAQKKITDNSGKTIIKTYKYGTNECGYGIINNEPGIGMIGYENTVVGLLNWDGWCRVYPAQELELYRERYYFSDILPQYSIYFDRPVIYPEVTEYDGEIGNNNGKIIYSYESLKQYFAELPYSCTDCSISRKYVRKFDYWRMNQLKEKVIFDKNGNKIRKEIYKYTSKPKEEITGMHLEQIYVYPNFDKEECASTFPHPIFSFNDYTVSSGVKLLSSQTEIMYYGANDSIEAKTNYTYNDNQLLSKTEKIDNNGNLITTYYYPDDYNAEQNFSVLRDSVKNIVGKPIDTRTYKGTDLIAGTQTKYNDYGQPIEVFQMERQEGDPDIPIDINNPYTFIQKADYSYNTNKRLQEAAPVDNIKTIFIWGYNANYPVAKIDNISAGSLSSVILNIENHSFTCSNVFADIQTDVNYLRLQLSDYVNNSDYKVSFYTYKPLVGMTSETGPDGRTTYYEYDDFGRLKLVRNHTGEITNKYHYQHGTDQ